LPKSSGLASLNLRDQDTSDSPSLRRLPIPIEVRPHAGATMAIGAADESRLNIGQPGIIRPAIAIDRNRMAAAVVSAIDQQAANALGTQVGEGDFLRAVHGP